MATWVDAREGYPPEYMDVIIRMENGREFIGFVDEDEEWHSQSFYDIEKFEESRELFVSQEVSKIKEWTLIPS